MAICFVVAAIFFSFPKMLNFGSRTAQSADPVGGTLLPLASISIAKLSRLI
jgi:hypothetical protein